jgi:hypothetical protein
MDHGKIRQMDVGRNLQQLICKQGSLQGSVAGLSRQKKHTFGAQGTTRRLLVEHIALASLGTETASEHSSKADAAPAGSCKNHSLTK